VVGTGAYSQSGGSASKSAETISAASVDESGVLVNEDGKLTLSDVVVTTTGSSSSSDDSSFYGLDAAVIALNGSTVSETGGSVTTSGDGANAIFSYGSGSSVAPTGVVVSASGQYAHGVMASGGGSLTADDLTVTTTGANGAAVATDRGGGTITVLGGTYRTSRMSSPGIYSTGTITASDATFDATGAEAAVIEGSNSVTVTDSHLTGSVNRGVMIYQSMSGDAQGSAGVFSETGGSLTALSGPIFYVTNTTAAINLSCVALDGSSGVQLDAAAGQWGASGSSGGQATFNAVDQTLSGSVDVDGISTVALDLSDRSTLSGAINAAASAKSVSLSLDSSSRWTVTGTSYLTVLSDSAGISGSNVTNIVGDGHTVYYTSSANPSLDGRTYALLDGGTLTPA
jgi:hypothetical protein